MRALKPDKEIDLGDFLCHDTGWKLQVIGVRLRYYEKAVGWYVAIGPVTVKRKKAVLCPSAIEIPVDDGLKVAQALLKAHEHPEVQKDREIADTIVGFSKLFDEQDKEGGGTND